jgi:hypothetical protein
MGLTRIRLQLAIYFCLHRGNIREKAAREQARKTGVLRLAKRGTAANQGYRVSRLKNFGPQKLCAIGGRNHIQFRTPRGRFGVIALMCLTQRNALVW